MANPVSEVVKEVTETPKQIVSWAKAKPFIFGVLVLVLVLLTLRFRSKIARFFVGLPGVGKVFAKVIGMSAAAGVALIVLDGGKALAANSAAVADPGGHAGLWAMVMLYTITLCALALRFARRKGVR
jgi:hypothetical protein